MSLSQIAVTDLAERLHLHPTPQATAALVQSIDALRSTHAATHRHTRFGPTTEAHIRQAATSLGSPLQTVHPG